MRLVTSGADFQNILEQQYYLASKVGIPISDSNNMADFERLAFVNMYMKEMKKRKEALDKIK